MNAKGESRPVPRPRARPGAYGEIRIAHLDLDLILGISDCYIGSSALVSHQLLSSVVKTIRNCSLFHQRMVLICFIGLQDESLERIPTSSNTQPTRSTTSGDC